MADPNDKFYVKAFLIDDSLNINNWRVTRDSIERNINSFIGKPLVLTEKYDHPSPNQGHPETLNHWLSYQESFRIGSIIDIVTKPHPAIPNARTYHAIIEVTNPDAKAALRNNKLPIYVSPAIAELVNIKSAFSSWEHCHSVMMTQYGDKETADRVCGHLKSLGQANAKPSLTPEEIKAMSAMSWEECISQATKKGANDPEKLCGWLRFHGPNASVKDPQTGGELVSEWTGVHLAVVSEPAFGVKKATISHTCGGSEKGCLLQLRQAHVAKNGVGKCGFCVTKALSDYVLLRQMTASRANSSTVKNVPAANTSQFKSTTANSLEKRFMSQLESADSNAAATTTGNNNTEVGNTNRPVEVVEQTKTIQNQPVKTPYSSTAGLTVSDLSQLNANLKAENELLRAKVEELSNVKDTISERIAAMEMERRREKIERIITPDVIKDDKQRLEKVKYFVSTTIPVEHIEELYNGIKVTLRKASANARTGGRVHYGMPSQNSGSGNVTISEADGDQFGLTPLQKQLAVLRGMH